MKIPPGVESTPDPTASIYSIKALSINLLMFNYVIGLVVYSLWVAVVIYM